MKSQSSLFQSIPADHILYIQAKGNYLYIHFNGKKNKQLLRTTLKKAESHYKNSFLMRVHNSYIVNLEKVVKVESNKLHLFSNLLHLSIPVSRKYVKQVKLKLKSILALQEDITYTANDPGYPF